MEFRITQTEMSPKINRGGFVTYTNSIKLLCFRQKDSFKFFSKNK